MHVAGLMVLDPSTIPDGFSMQNIHEFYESRLHLAAPFRRRLAEIPLGIHHPLWIEDPDFDLDQHLHHIAVPPPGGQRELAALAADLVKMPLDRSRPLWECWIIEGPRGRQRRRADEGPPRRDRRRRRATRSPLRCCNSRPTTNLLPRPRSGSPIVYRPTSSCSRTRRRRSPVSRWRLAKTARRTIESTLQVRERNRRPDVEPPPGLFNAPRTSFNVALTPHRDFAFTSLSLPDVKMVKNALGVSVNDVVLGLCAGALRQYLEHARRASGRTARGDGARVGAHRGAEGHARQPGVVDAVLARDGHRRPVERLLTIHDGTTRGEGADQHHRRRGPDRLGRVRGTGAARAARCGSTRAPGWPIVTARCST